MRRLSGLWPCVLLVGLAACSSGPKKPPPTPLADIKPQITGRVVWTSRISSIDFPMSIAVNAGQFTVAASDGTVMALDAESGRVIWKGNAGAQLSAGVGSDGQTAAVVTEDGNVVAMDAGKVLWSVPLATRVVSAPLVAGGRVFVMGVDRSVAAFDAKDGLRLWSVPRSGDPLNLSQTGVLAPFKDTLLAGQSSKLAGLDPLSGGIRWEVALAMPRGTNEIERLADLVGPAVRVGDFICARSFQSAVGCVDAQNGKLLWSRNAGGRMGVAADAKYLVAADASDRITAWKMGSGEVAWTSDVYLFRSLSTPLIVGPVVTFGDLEGNLIFLSTDKGAAQLRVPTDGSPLAAAPVVSGMTLLAVTQNGGLFALRP